MKVYAEEHIIEVKPSSQSPDVIKDSDSDEESDLDVVEEVSINKEDEDDTERFMVNRRRSKLKAVRNVDNRSTMLGPNLDTIRNSVNESELLCDS